MSGRLVRLFHTVRHLRALQLCGRLQSCVASVSRRLPQTGAGRLPDYPGCCWSRPRDILPPASEGIQAEAIRRGEFRFLNISQQIGFPPHWNHGDCPKLWLYNLHYFDWLWALDFDTGKQVALDWIAKHPAGDGRMAWDAYPTSLRLMNWCGFFFGRFRDETEKQESFAGVLWASLYTQCEWLGKHLEIHLLGNHYLENAAALVLLGTCFHGEKPRRWFRQGMRILSRQIDEQILPDGVHFELSPMYHCRVLYVLATLLATEVAEIKDIVAEPADRMAQALQKLCHPDGGMALLSDSAQGICHEPLPLLSHGRRHRLLSFAAGDACGCFALPDAGYYGWRDSEGMYLVADYGKVGPDYNPGHGHADMFGFELSLNGQRVVTDSGVHDYEASIARRCSRSTAAHNTVEVGGRDQCELWGVFRVARRGYPHGVTWHPNQKGFTLSGWHDGYRRLPGKPVHTRWMQWEAGDGLTVRDTVTARRPVHCISRLHLHPACRIVAHDGQRVRVSHPGGSFLVEAGGTIEVKETPYFERFYETQLRPCLCLTGRGQHIQLQYRIQVGETA